MGNQSIGGLWRSEDGVTAIEYALIAGIVVIAIVAAVSLIGDGLHSVFSNVANGFPQS